MRAEGARAAAVRALGAVRRGSFSQEAVEAAARSLDGRDAALCARLVYGELQNRYYLDHCIGNFCRTPVGRLEPLVLDILRISALQLLFFDRVPQSAAVSEGVELCRALGAGRAAGLVNAVLRRIAERRSDPPEVPGEGTAEYLSVRYSHPLWLVKEFVKSRGYQGAEALLRANNGETAVYLQANSLKISGEELLQRLRERGYEASPGMSAGELRVERPGDVRRLPGYAEGLFYVQDAAARLAVEAAAPRPGERVLDACAAPGGKSFTAAMLMRGEGEILSCDIQPKKLHRIQDGAARLGVDIILTRAMDARRPEAELHSAFDVVIADVPCSGLGVIRKKPEIRYKPAEELEGLPAIQLEILSALSGCVRPGGRLLYSTCTLRERENGGVTHAFLERAGEFTLRAERTLWPDVDGTDGFYICLMEKSQ